MAGHFYECTLFTLGQKLNDVLFVCKIEKENSQ